MGAVLLAAVEVAAVVVVDVAVSVVEAVAEAVVAAEALVGVTKAEMLALIVVSLVGSGRSG